jgi:hypothetical protein
MLSGNGSSFDALQERRQFISSQIGIDSQFAWQVSHRGEVFKLSDWQSCPKTAAAARGGAQQVEQHSYGGRLASAVQPEESKNFPSPSPLSV